MVNFKQKAFLSRRVFYGAIKDSFRMLSPAIQIRNPVMFVTYLCAVVTSVIAIHEIASGMLPWFNVQISLWLWFTVLFANFAEAIAESRGKAQALSLRQAKEEATAKVLRNETIERVSLTTVKRGDVVICDAGDLIPADGDVIDGVATVDESAITGESAPVIRESGGDRSAVTAGTRVISDRLKISVTSEPGNSFLDHIIGLVEGAKRQRTPNEVALHIVLSGLTIIFLLTVTTLKFFSDYSANAAHEDLSSTVTVTVLLALLVCLIPTTISALLSAVGIAGMDRLIRRNVIAKSGRAVEAAGDIDLLILDKTGTITMGNRQAAQFLPAPGTEEKNLAYAAQLASLSDETPEGRSIVVLAKNRYNLRAEDLQVGQTVVIPFSAKTRMSGIDVTEGSGGTLRQIRKGAADAIRKHIESLGGVFPREMDGIIHQVARSGGTPLLVSEGSKILGVVHLKDIIKGGIRERFAEMRRMGIRTLMITGDNPLTAAAIAAEAGVDDYIAEATPEMKLTRIRQEQLGGRLIAMTGDGTNDAPALAQADVGVAMNTGTQASREAGNMVDLDSSPTKLLDIVEIGKQLLITRGALTTFSIANDVAKYFAIIPAIFASLYAVSPGEPGPLAALNIMHLHSPQSAILSAVIFNALVIIALVPLALRGVSYKALSAHHLLRRNILTFGLGGLICPFISIKIIDLIVSGLAGL